MSQYTIVQSRLDHRKVIVLAAVNRNGVYEIEQYEILNTEEALNNLLTGLYGQYAPAKARFPHPIALTGVPTCECCGIPIVGFDSQELFG